MAGAAQTRTDHAARPRPEEGRLSNSNSKVVRLRPVSDTNKLRIVDEEQRRQRLTSVLTQLVQRDIVPRLLSSLPAPTAGTIASQPLTAPAPRSSIPSDAPTQDAVVAFTDTLLTGTPGDAALIVSRLRASGVSPRTLCLHLLTGAARYLGELWVSDLASFADVTLATDQLQLIFRDLATEIAVPRPTRPVAPAALLVATPGEQHSFGLTMLATFFRGAGWTALTPRVRNAVDVQRKVAASHIEMLGFSLGTELHLTRLGRCIELARRSSCNRALVVMVGGPAFVARPELASSVGADATASDAAGALEQAERLILARRP